MATKTIEEALALLNAQSNDTAKATSQSIDELIATAREKLALAPKPATDTSLEVSATDPDMVSSLVAQAAELKHIADSAVKERAKITDLLAELTGEEGVLVVHHAPVFTVHKVSSRVLNQTHLKSVFPDIAGNEECWTDQVSVRRTYN